MTHINNTYIVIHMAASSSTWVVVQSRNYRFWIFFGVLRPMLALFWLGSNLDTLVYVHFYMNKTLNHQFYDNREYDEQ